MRRIHRFGVFSFDPEQLELRRLAQPVRLQPQPARALALLLEHAGRVVSREAFQQALWGSETFVDFDRGLNFCIAQIRTALGDDAVQPRYVRTVPKKGYEFICPIETSDAGALVPPPADSGATRRATQWIAIASLLVVSVVGGSVWFLTHHAHRRPAIVAVVPFDNETADPGWNRFGESLTDNIVERLAASSEGRYQVIGNAAILRTAREQRDLTAIASSLNANYVILGQVQRDGARIRVLGHLIRLPDQVHVAVARFDGLSDQSLATTDAITTGVTARFLNPLKNAVGSTRAFSSR
jgi:DNA-binding winged helix-turn-helix (wHTH) protein/TolB-like protein